ncbi:unnamed protein product [Closterium sp. NIES-53]
MTPLPTAPHPSHAPPHPHLQALYDALSALQTARLPAHLPACALKIQLAQTALHKLKTSPPPPAPPAGGEGEEAGEGKAEGEKGEGEQAEGASGTKQTASGSAAPGMCPAINTHLLPPTPPRPTHLLTWHEALDHFARLLSHFSFICHLPSTSPPDLLELSRFLAHFRALNPGPVARAALQWVCDGRTCTLYGAVCPDLLELSRFLAHFLAHFRALNPGPVARAALQVCVCDGCMCDGCMRDGCMRAVQVGVCALYGALLYFLRHSPFSPLHLSCAPLPSSSPHQLLLLQDGLILGHDPTDIVMHSLHLHTLPLPSPRLPSPPLPSNTPSSPPPSPRQLLLLRDVYGHILGHDPTDVVMHSLHLPPALLPPAGAAAGGAGAAGAVAGGGGVGGGEAGSSAALGKFVKKASHVSGMGADVSGMGADVSGRGQM